MTETTSATLTVLGGPLAGTRCVLPESGTVTLGSSPGSSLCLDLPTVSPYHARIVVEAGRVTAHDTGAARALHVNDNPLDAEGTVLRNGDILWLGSPGEDDVVMLQCILPRRSVVAPSPDAVPVEPDASPSPVATPTPEVETVALWTVGPGAASPPVPRVAAEPVQEQATGFEETMAIRPGAPAPAEPTAPPGNDDEDLVVEASLPAEGEEEMFAAEVVAEPVAFIEEAGPSPTLLMALPQEVVEPGVPEAAPPPPIPATPEPRPLPVAPPSDSAPPLRETRPAPPARPAQRPTHASASTPPPRRDGPVRHAPPPPRHAPAEPEAAANLPKASPAASRSTLLAAAGFMGVLVIAGLGWVAWRFLAERTPTPTPSPVAQAQAPPVTLPAATPEPTPEAIETTPPPDVAPTLAPTASPVTTPTPAPTPTPRATPTPAVARPTPTPPPAATAPSADAARAQQAAAQAQALLGQAETALGARQYDAAISHLDGALRVEPGNTSAASLRSDAVRRRDLARRRFVAGRTAVQARKDAGADLAGFDTGDADLRKAPDFLGRVEFEMTPASGIEPGDAWTLRAYVVNEGKKPIRIASVTVGTTVNGAGSGGAVPPRAREIAPQQRALVAEAAGSWRDGTSAWSTAITVTAGKGESLQNTITWR